MPRETWRDWQAKYAPHVPEPTIENLWTRDQLMAELPRVGVTASQSTLRSWERLGILPSPVRHNINGSSRVLYPLWFGYLVAIADAERRRDRPIADIAAAVRGKAADVIAFSDTQTDAWADIIRKLEDVLIEWANRYRERLGAAPALIQINALDESGKLIGSYQLPLREKE